MHGPVNVKWLVSLDDLNTSSHETLKSYIFGIC